MNRAIALMAALVILFTGVTPAYAVGGIASEYRGEDTRFQPCRGKDERRRLRCEARFNRRSKTTRFDLLKGEGSVETRSTLGIGRLRKYEKLKRERLNQERLQRRKTYLEQRFGSDYNTKRVNYLTKYRKDRLNCMLESPGRPRRLCFDKLQHEIHNTMDAAR